MALKTQDELIQQLLVLAKELGWKVALPILDEESGLTLLPGILMGTDDYLDWMLHADEDHELLLRTTKELN
jgi:hypothetical protein